MDGVVRKCAFILELGVGADNTAASIEVPLRPCCILKGDKKSKNCS
jgi:hypothetical protein